MFTGIVKGIGSVSGVNRRNGGLRLRVHYAEKDEFSALAIDESVSVNGACQTVVAVGEGWFEVDTVEETLAKTTLGSLRNGSAVNLERAIRPIDRLGGHFVLGHVDCVGEVNDVRELGTSREIWISYPGEFDPFIVSAGSITIDGISLTVNHCGPDFLEVNVIPETQGVTTIASWKPGTRVNMETDVIGKYVQNMLAPWNTPHTGEDAPSGRITLDFLRENGF